MLNGHSYRIFPEYDSRSAIWDPVLTEQLEVNGTTNRPAHMFSVNHDLPDWKFLKSSIIQNVLDYSKDIPSSRKYSNIPKTCHYPPISKLHPLHEPLVQFLNCPSFGIYHSRIDRLFHLDHALDAISKNCIFLTHHMEMTWHYILIRLAPTSFTIILVSVK